MNYEQLNALVPRAGNEPDWTSLVFLMPFLKDLEKTPQDKHWHPEGDVWIHTQMVVRKCVNSAFYQSVPNEERFILFYASLFHDIGKPATTKIEEDGRISSKGHSGRGQLDARIFLWSAGIPFSIREQICSIIEHHLTPFYVFRKTEESTLEVDYRIKKLSWDVGRMDLLLNVCEADMRGRTYIKMEDELANLELVRISAEELKCMTAPYKFKNKSVARRYFVNRGSISEQSIELFPGATKSTVHIMHGLPASGKDTWVAKNNVASLPVLSYDDTVKELGLRHPNIGAAVHLVHDRAKTLLAKGDAFYWNATHLNPMYREKTLDMVHNYNGASLLYYLETSREELFRRNAERGGTLTNKRLTEMLFGWDIAKPYEAVSINYIIDGQPQVPYFKHVEELK